MSGSGKRRAHRLDFPFLSREENERAEPCVRNASKKFGRMPLPFFSTFAADILYTKRQGKILPHT